MGTNRGNDEMQDAWRAYLELALGLTAASRKTAQRVVRDLVDRGEATAAQVQTTAAELVSTGRANRETLVRLVRFEVDRALGAVGLATAEEVADLSARVAELERRQRAHRAALPAEAPGTEKDAKPVGKKTVTKKTVAKKAVAKKTVAKKTVAKKSAAKQAGAGQAGSAA